LLIVRGCLVTSHSHLLAPPCSRLPPARWVYVTQSPPLPGGVQHQVHPCRKTPVTLCLVPGRAHSSSGGGRVGGQWQQVSVDMLRSVHTGRVLGKKFLCGEIKFSKVNICTNSALVFVHPFLKVSRLAAIGAKYNFAACHMVFRQSNSFMQSQFSPSSDIVCSPLQNFFNAVPH